MRLGLLQTGLFIIAPFLVGGLLVVFGIGVYVGMEEPMRMAMRQVSATNLVILEPQPGLVSPVDSNVMITRPPQQAFFNGVITNAAIWVAGKPFNSGGRAAWELGRNAWPLYLFGGATLMAGWYLSPFRKRYTGAAPEGNPAKVLTP